MVMCANYNYYKIKLKLMFFPLKCWRSGQVDKRVCVKKLKSCVISDERPLARVEGRIDLA